MSGWFSVQVLAGNTPDIHGPIVDALSMTFTSGATDQIAY